MTPQEVRTCCKILKSEGFKVLGRHGDTAQGDFSIRSAGGSVFCCAWIGEHWKLQPEVKSEVWKLAHHCISSVLGTAPVPQVPLFNPKKYVSYASDAELMR